jgi:hypothetical protein
MFTRALNWSVSRARSIQSILPHLIYLKSILILTITYILVFLVVSFLLAGPTIFYMHSSSPPFVLHALPTSCSWLDHSNHTWRKVQVMKLLIMQFPSTSRQYISLRPKHSSQHSILKHPQSMVLP